MDNNQTTRHDAQVNALTPEMKLLYQFMVSEGKEPEASLSELHDCIAQDALEGSRKIY